ncbi:MAG: amidohydrolase, partial [Dehalococcoidia bacterium]
MASKEELKKKVRDAIDQRAEEIVRVSKTILDNPETGFREMKTSKLVENLFAEAGIDHRSGLALTGVKGEIRGGSNGPSVAVIGELDSLIVSEHPHASPETAAAHACGHHA